MSRNLSAYLAKPMTKALETEVSLLRILGLLFFILALFFVGYEIWESDYVYGCRKYFFESKDVIQLDFRELTPISEMETKRRYPITWFCRNEPSEFGDRYCADNLIKEWNGIPAMYAMFWYKKDKLSNAKIDIPRWHHDKLVSYMKRVYGEPDKMNSELDVKKISVAILKLATRNIDGIPEINSRIAGLWELDNGAWVMANVLPEQNPFSWDTIFWFSPESVKEMERESQKDEKQNEQYTRSR